MNDPTTGTEKVAGTNLTTVAEFAKSALALSELEARFKGIVVAVDTPKGMKEAKSATFELRTLRTSIEKMRKEIVAPLIDRKKNVDDEGKRLTALIVALEEPIDIQIKAQEAKVQQELLARQEAEQARVNNIRTAIQAFRDEPSKLVGKPAHIINGALVRLQSTTVLESGFEEFTREAQDALIAAISHITTMLAQQQAQEAEQAQIKADREKLAQLEREAEERRAADAERDRAEREAADREAQATRDEAARVEAEERAEGLRVARERDEAERAEKQAVLDAQREAQEAEQRKLDEQAAQLKRDQQAAAAKAEQERLAGLGLRQAAQAVVEYFQGATGIVPVPRVIQDLAAALANDAKPATAKKGKK